MASSTAKRVLVYRFERLAVEGMVDLTGWLHDGFIELLALDGTLQRVGYSDLKALCFFSGSAPHDLFSADFLFPRRPKTAGLWTRFTFRDGSQLDGILPHNLLEWPAQGYLFAPPKAGAGRQRVFVPREALNGTELMGVVGLSTAKPQAQQRPAETPSQIDLF